MFPKQSLDPALRRNQSGIEATGSDASGTPNGGVVDHGAGTLGMGMAGTGFHARSGSPSSTVDATLLHTAAAASRETASFIAAHHGGLHSFNMMNDVSDLKPQPHFNNHPQPLSAHKKNWTPEDDELIIRHKVHGDKTLDYDTIATMTGRSWASVKSRWNNVLRKKHHG